MPLKEPALTGEADEFTPGILVGRHGVLESESRCSVVVFAVALGDETDAATGKLLSR